MYFFNIKGLIADLKANRVSRLDAMGYTIGTLLLLLWPTYVLIIADLINLPTQIFGLTVHDLQMIFGFVLLFPLALIEALVFLIAWLVFTWLTFFYFNNAHGDNKATWLRYSAIFWVTKLSCWLLDILLGILVLVANLGEDVRSDVTLGTDVLFIILFFWAARQFKVNSSYAK